jgi:hypothetical protein
MISMKVTGVNRVRNNLRRFVSDHKKIFDPVISDHVKGLQRLLSRKKAPAKLPRQKYIRTGRLQSSFSARKISPAVWTIRNSAPYATWVVKERVGNVGQAAIHQGRWFTIEEEERKLRPQLTRNLTKRAVEYFD